MNYHDFILENTFYFDEAKNNNNNTNLQDKKEFEKYKAKLEKKKKDEEKAEKKAELKKYNKNLAVIGAPAAIAGVGAGYGIYRLLKRKNDKDVEKELNESYIDGYYDALLEINEDKIDDYENDYNILNEVHLSRYAKHYKKSSRNLEKIHTNIGMRQIKREYKEGKISKKEYDNLCRKKNNFTHYNAFKYYDEKNMKDMSRKEVRDAFKDSRRKYAKLPYKAAGVAAGGVAGGVAVASSLNAYNHNLYRAWINKDPKKRKDVTFKEWKKMGKPKN